MKETKFRSVVKAITWRCIGLVITYCSALSIGIDQSNSVKLAMIANVAALSAFYVHERVWNNVEFGRDDE